MSGKIKCLLSVKPWTPHFRKAIRCDTKSHSIDWNAVSYNIIVRNRSIEAWMLCVPGFWADDWQSKSWKWWILLGILLHNEFTWTFKLNHFQRKATKRTHNTSVSGFAIKRPKRDERWCFTVAEPQPDCVVYAISIHLWELSWRRNENGKKWFRLSARIFRLSKECWPNQL